MLKGINSWIASEVFAKLLGKLDVPEANGQNLPRTTRWSTGATSWDSITSPYSVPCLLAGKRGRFHQAGCDLDYIDWNAAPTSRKRMATSSKVSPHNRLLVTILQAMGLGAADYERGGNRATVRPTPPATIPGAGPSTTT